jgi:hypothetical protein
MSIAPTRRPRALIALGALALALATAGPASAEPKQPTETAKKGCPLTLPDGSQVVWPHGSPLTIRTKGSNGVTIEQSWRCNDGKWEPTKPLHVQPTATVNVPTLSASKYPSP